MKLYLEMTTFNYYFDADRNGHVDTVKLFDEIREGKHEAYTSLYAVEELEDTQELKRSKMIELIDEYNITVLPTTDESDQLADIYISEGVIPEKYQLDGAHISIACIHKLDCVLSYNFKHIN